MPTQTGTVANTGTLLTDLATFATAQGWTVNRNTFAATSGAALQMTNGVCAIAITNETVNVTSFPGGVSTPYTQHRLLAALATSIGPAITTYWGHPGSLVTSNADTDRMACNFPPGPYNYWFFAPASGQKYIHVVVKVGSIYTHFSFGHIDRRQFTHSGVAYISTHAALHYRDNATLASTSHWDTRETRMIGKNRWINGPETTSGEQIWQRCIYSPDALPVGWTEHRTFWNGCAPLFHLGSQGPPASQAQAGDAALSRPCQLHIQDGPLGFSGVMPLWPMPVIPTDTALDRACYIGDFPDTRLVNIGSFTPEQTVTFAGETWQIFPQVRKTPWYSAAIDEVSSGNLGLAYKVIA